MKKLSFTFCVCLLQIIAFAQENKSDVAIIPEPVSITKNPGRFTLPKNVVIRSGSSADVVYINEFLTNKISKATGYSVTENNTSTEYTIRLILNKDSSAVLGNEGQ
jgi:hexosaminidase